MFEPVRSHLGQKSSKTKNTFESRKSALSLEGVTKILETVLSGADQIVQEKIQDEEVVQDEDTGSAPPTIVLPSAASELSN